MTPIAPTPTPPPRPYQNGTFGRAVGEGYSFGMGFSPFSPRGKGVGG